MNKKKSVLQILKQNYKTIFRLLQYSKSFRKSYIFALVINSLTMARFSFVIGFSLQWVTDSVLEGRWNEFRSAITFAAIAFTINAILYYFEGYEVHAVWALHVISAILKTGIVSAMAYGLEIGRGHHLLFHLAQRCIPHEVACHWWCAPFSKAKKRRSLISKTPALEYYMIGSWL